MFGYYLQLALRSFRRNRVLTALMVLAIALGIGASMTTLTVYYILSGDPLPGQSQHLYEVQLDPQSLQGYEPGQEPAEQVTRYDAETLLAERRAPRQAMMSGGNVSVQPGKAGLAPFYAPARYTSADFFPMFHTRLLFGQGWSAADDAAHARVAVITKSLNDKLFGGANSVGKPVRLAGQEFRVAGVMGDWNPNPHFYDLNVRGFGGAEDVMVPFTTSRDLNMDRSGSMDCWGDSKGDGTAVGANCVWIQYWVELDDAAQASAYRRYLVNYSTQQHAAGRFQRPPNVRLRSVMQWLSYKQIVPGDVRLQVLLAFGFLLVCLVNTVGLLLAKFLRRSSEMGIRRALGASRRAIFLQCLVEAGMVGLVGGMLGLGLAALGLWGVRHQPTQYAPYVHLDLAMLALTFVLALLASLLAGVLPAWRAMQVTPAMQLKAQ
ncbi:MAG TPA: ABC transporter permease [Steroidobacteraceae bacterium]|nr:ABC transporter permease [Steroidobacteraceae bacterium]